MFLTPTCTKLGRLHSHPYNKKMRNDLNISDFSWTHQRVEVMGRAVTLKPREVGESGALLLKPAYQTQK